LWRQILIPEEDDTAFCDEEGQFITLSIRKIFKLQTNYLGANVHGEIVDFLRSREECLFSRIGMSTSLSVLAIDVSDVVDVLQVQRFGGTVGVAIAKVYACLF